MKNLLFSKKYKVDGMHCVSCAMLIESELEDAEVADQATCNYATLELEIESQKEIDDGKICEVVDRLGYKVKPID